MFGFLGDDAGAQYPSRAFLAQGLELADPVGEGEIVVIEYRDVPPPRVLEPDVQRPRAAAAHHRDQPELSRDMGRQGVQQILQITDYLQRHSWARTKHSKSVHSCPAKQSSVSWSVSGRLPCVLVRTDKKGISESSSADSALTGPADTRGRIG